MYVNFLKKQETQQMCTKYIDILQKLSMHHLHMMLEAPRELFITNLVRYVIKLSIFCIFYENFSMKSEFLGLYNKDLDLLISLTSFR